MSGCLKVVLLGCLVVVSLSVIGRLNRPAPQITDSNPDPSVVGTVRRVPNPGPVAGDLDRIFEAAREQRMQPAHYEEGDEKELAQIKAVYAAEKLGLPVRIVPTYDWFKGFRYIVVTDRKATHVVYLTPDGDVVSVRDVYDARGKPKGLAFLYRKAE